MTTVPENYPGPNVAGSTGDQIPYYAYGHTAGEYLKEVPGPWAAGNVPVYVPQTEAPAPPGTWAKFVFNQVEAGQTVQVYIYRVANDGGDFTVHWNDGTVDVLPASDPFSVIDHTYENGGKKTIYVTGSPSNADELSAQILFGEYQEYQLGADEVEVSSTSLEYFYNENWPTSITLDCPSLYELQLGPLAPDIGNVGSASLLQALMQTVPTVHSLYARFQMSGSLDLSFADLTYFVAYNLVVSSLKLPTSVYYVYFDYAQIESVYMDGCASLSTLFSGLSGTTHVECSNASQYVMNTMLAICNGNGLDNGTFVGTGNGAPTGQAATNKQNLIDRGWTVTTD